MTAYTDDAPVGRELRRASAWAKEAILHPRDLLSRLGSRVELARQLPPILSLPSPCHEWESVLHADWGVCYPCACEQDFQRVWARVMKDVGGLRPGHDADSALARVVYMCGRHAVRGLAVETGVARGITSRLILEATAGTKARVWSIDLPPLLPEWNNERGRAVRRLSQDMSQRWHFVRGSSRRVLRRVLETVGVVDIFIHDSLHTTPTVLFELLMAWRHLRVGGLCIVDDADRNDGLMRFLNNQGEAQLIVVDQPAKGGRIGVLLKRRAFGA